MNQASPADLRKELEAAQALTKAGILFVPMPVLNEIDHAELQAEVVKRLGQIAEAIEQGLSHDNQ